MGRQRLRHIRTPPELHGIGNRMQAGKMPFHAETPKFSRRILRSWTIDRDGYALNHMRSIEHVERVWQGELNALGRVQYDGVIRQLQSFHQYLDIKTIIFHDELPALAAIKQITLSYLMAVRAFLPSYRCHFLHTRYLKWAGGSILGMPQRKISTVLAAIHISSSASLSSNPPGKYHTP